MQGRLKRIGLLTAALVLVISVTAVGIAAGARGGKGPSPRTERTGEPAATAPPAGAAAKGERPNVVFILTDDQPDSSFRPELMPRSYRLLTGKGANFGDAIAAPPLCCPYRAGLISGQYAHNNNVKTNRPGYADLRRPERVLPAFLQEAGYRTGFVGKYLNGTAAALGGKPAPGWDRWYELIRRSYTGAKVSDQGRIRKLGERIGTTATVTRQASRFIDSASGRGKPPFFLTVAHFAPHPDRAGGGPCRGGHIAKASRRDYRFARQFRLPLSRSYGERNVSDKPALVRRQPRLHKSDRPESQRAWRCAVAALQPVDRGIAGMFKQLRRSGELDNTWIIFGSDNGFNYGEHRLIGKKGFYEEMLQVPLVIRPPTGAPARFNSARGSRLPQLVSEVDASATILDIAGAQPCLEEFGCRDLDGRSLLPLLAGEDESWPRDRGIPLQLGNCRIYGLRTPRRVLIESRSSRPGGGGCRTDFTELYDLRRDPDQLRNIARKRPRLTEKLAARMDRDLDCRGAPDPADERSCE